MKLHKTICFMILCTALTGLHTSYGASQDEKIFAGRVLQAIALAMPVAALYKGVHAAYAYAYNNGLYACTRKLLTCPARSFRYVRKKPQKTALLLCVFTTLCVGSKVLFDEGTDEIIRAHNQTRNL